MKRLAWFRRQREAPEPDLIGHPALGGGESFEHEGVRYISIDEAIYRQGRGEAVSVRFESTPEDEVALASFRMASQEKLSRLREDYRQAHRVDGPEPRSRTVREDQAEA